jgi:hypothetical protein
MVRLSSLKQKLKGKVVPKLLQEQANPPRIDHPAKGKPVYLYVYLKSPRVPISIPECPKHTQNPQKCQLNTAILNRPKTSG